MFLNEYTKSIIGTPYYKSVGIIKVYDKYNRDYNVGEIIFERFDEQNFQYIIKPYWELIKFIPEGIFQGIPGINMNIKKESYYRVNMTPVFISMRTPSESRENIQELMTSVGLDYYDRFEWLLRSEAKCGDDNLFVVRKPSYNRLIKDLNHTKNINPDDVIELNKLCDIQSSNSKLIENMYLLFQSGAKIYIKSENRFIDNIERTTMLYLLGNMLQYIDQNNKNHRKEGIKKAKANGKYTGRKPIEIDSQLLKQVAIAFLNNHISEKTAMKKLGINSRSTFYRKIKTYRKT